MCRLKFLEQMPWDDYISVIIGSILTEHGWMMHLRGLGAESEFNFNFQSLIQTRISIKCL